MKPTAFLRYFPHDVTLGSPPMYAGSRQSLLAMTVLAARMLALCMTASTSHAATIVYNFNDTIAYSSNLGTGSAVTTNNFGSGITASNWTASSPVRTIGVQGGQVRALKSADTDTHSFTITIPNLVSQTVNLTSLSFNWGEAALGADTAIPTWTISSTVGSISPNSGSGLDGSSNLANLTLTGLTGLNNTSITFTLLDTSQGNNLNTTMYTWFDNVTLTGTVVPEPRAALLGGLGLLMLLRRRR